MNDQKRCVRLNITILFNLNKTVKGVIMEEEKDILKTYLQTQYEDTQFIKKSDWRLLPVKVVCNVT